MDAPLVSIICLCYNHQKFVKKSLESALFQQYPNFEILIIDDASTDQSVQEIENFLQEVSAYRSAAQDRLQGLARIDFWKNQENQGNCRSFNQVLQEAKGKYIIDLATDDILLDDRLSKQVQLFESLDDSYGVIFSNALEIDEKGHAIHYHYPLQGTPPPSGNVYTHILQKYFICTATMMIRKSVLQELDGYDENLSYEDFDFWVRSSRKYLYHYQPEVTTCKRRVKNSHSSAFYQKKNNPHLQSTLEVCKKALHLNQTLKEDEALAKGIQYYLRFAFYLQHFELALAFNQLLNQMECSGKKTTRLVVWLAKKKIKVFIFYRIYARIFLQKKI